MVEITMVEVVGRDNKKVKKTTCSQCAAKLEYTESEVENRNYICCGQNESGRFITCPVCKHWLEIGY